MVFSIIKWSILSLTLIFLIHHLYTFLMNTLTVPKIKDLVNKPQEQYKELFQTANGRSGSGGGENFKTIEANDTMKDMTDELSMFLNDLKKTDANANAIGANAMGSIGANAMGSMDYNANVIGANVIGANANAMGSNVMGTMEYNYASL